MHRKSACVKPYECGRNAVVMPYDTRITPLVFKQADKGGGLVILNRKDYVKEANRLLNDAESYTPLTGDPTDMFLEELRPLLVEGLHKGIISKEEYQYLLIKCPIIPIFYYLPKIHKNLNNPPGRPIIACIGSLITFVRIC